MSQLPDSNTSFGLTIAYLIPGFVSLLAVAQYSPMIHSWLASQPGCAPTVGGFLYASVTSFTLGLTLSTIRWFVLDRLHHCTGIPRPAWNFSKLQENIDAFQIAVDYHYRYYQFYGGTLIVLVLLVFLPHPLAGLLPGGMKFHRWLLATLSLLFFLASRDALQKYYGRAIAVHDQSRHDKESRHDERLEAAQAAGSDSERTTGQ